MPDVELVVSEWDGAAWFENNRIVVNVRWLNVEEEAVWYIDESFMHEYIEHVLGLGHESAVYVERVLRKLLYSEWFGADPTTILYGRRRRIYLAGRRESTASPRSRREHLHKLSTYTAGGSTTSLQR